MINYQNALKFLRDTTQLKVEVLITETHSQFNFYSESPVVRWCCVIPDDEFAEKSLELISTIAVANINKLANCDLFSLGFDVPGAANMVMTPDLKGPADKPTSGGWSYHEK